MKLLFKSCDINDDIGKSCEINDDIGKSCDTNDDISVDIRNISVIKKNIDLLKYE